MVLSEAQKHDAYREAQQILRLDEKWQQLMPGEKRPNFERAAKEVLRRALGQRVQRNVEALDIKEGLMHEHKPREAHLIERFLLSGTVHPDAAQLRPRRHARGPAKAGAAGPGRHERPARV